MTDLTSALSYKGGNKIRLPRRPSASSGLLAMTIPSLAPRAESFHSDEFTLTYRNESERAG